MLDLSTASLNEAALEDAWWQKWWEQNYSWEGLRRHSCPSGHRYARQASPPISLQTYWRAGGEDRRPRADEQMQSELVTDPEGRLWHIAHVPLRWQDGSPAKEGWTAEQHAGLRRLLEQRLQQSLPSMDDTSRSND